MQKESGAHKLANGEPDKSENEGGTASKSKKKEKHSAEVCTTTGIRLLSVFCMLMCQIILEE